MKVVYFVIALVFVTTVQGNESKTQCKTEFGMILEENCERKWQCVWGRPILMPRCPMGMIYNKYGTCYVKGMGFDEDCKEDKDAKEVTGGVCSGKPCKNGGICNDWKDGKSFSCTCPWGYAGTTCQTKTKTDPCTTEPCKNGATCNSWADGNSFTCTCPWGYQGETCEEELMQRATLTPCMSYPCQNGGICKNSIDGKSYECECPGKYGGVNCQEEMTIEERCELDPKLLLPNAEHCHQFYNCSLKYKKVPMFFEQHLDECPYPFQFSTQTNSCRNFTEVQCGTRPEEKDGCDYVRNICPVSSCEPCKINFPSCENYTDGQHEHGYKKRPWYMICKDERVVATGICPYDAKAKTQSNPKDGKCSSE